MSDEVRTGPTAGQWAAIGLVGIVAIGAQISRELRKSPEQKREDRNKRRDKQALKREYEARKTDARRLDDSRWRQFEKDAKALATVQAERHTVISSKPLHAHVSYKRGGNYGHTWETITAERGAEIVIVHIDHDGGATVRYSNREDARVNDYKANFGTSYGYVTIGKRLDEVSHVQKRTARFVATMQAHGHYKGPIALAAPGNFYDVQKEHFARYAEARGWPPTRYGESDEVMRWYQDAIRSLS